MPIVNNGDNTHIEYTIPKDIKERIPDYFYYALAGELFSVHGWSYGIEWYVDEPDISDTFNFDSGTNAWTMAFKMTCRKLDMIWLWEYYDALEWYDSDMFDSEIENSIVEHFVNGKDEQANCYYKYLCEKE